MYCDNCGVKMQSYQRFCAACGKSAGSVPFMPAQGRIAGHLRLLGIFWLAASALSIIPAFVLLTFFRPGVYDFPEMPGFVHHLLVFIGMMLLAHAVLGIMTGWGLLEHQPWARMLAIVLGCFSLLNMPFGTALGIYTLWTLLPAKSEEEYRQLARVA
jgi:hypothetical protein